MLPVMTYKEESMKKLLTYKYDQNEEDRWYNYFKSTWGTQVWIFRSRYVLHW